MIRSISSFALAVAVAVAVATGGSANADSVATVAAVPVEDAMPLGPSVDERLSVIRQRIQRALRYPPLARLRSSDGDAVVRFEIGPSGVAHEIRVVRSSGHPQLDAAAARAVREAGRLPRVIGPLEVPVRFQQSTPRR